MECISASVVQTLAVARQTCRAHEKEMFCFTMKFANVPHFYDTLNLMLSLCVLVHAKVAISQTVRTPSVAEHLTSITCFTLSFHALREVNS